MSAILRRYSGTALEGFGALFGIVVSFLLSGCAATDTKDEALSSVQAAESTLIRFSKDPEMAWLQAHITEAKAVLVSPRFIKGGLVIGGSGGKAVLMARADSSWAGPALYTWTGASFGAQIGLQSSETVALVMTEKALRSLMSPSLKMSGELLVAVGPVGIGATAPVNADMLVFIRSKGLYGGFNMDGSMISPNQSANQAFYGRAVSPTEILIERTVSDPDAASIQRTMSSWSAK